MLSKYTQAHAVIQNSRYVTFSTTEMETSRILNEASIFLDSFPELNENSTLQFPENKLFYLAHA